MMTENRRITFKLAKPNPLFQKWLQELYDESKIKNSKLCFMLKEALNSISKYPLPLQSGSDCAVLKGFDKKLCLFLDKRLEVYNSGGQKNLPLISSSPSQHQRSVQENNQDSLNINPQRTPPEKKTKKHQKIYKPAYRSGGYAILITLLNNANVNPAKTTLKKNEIIEKAQPMCEESFTRPKPETYYTAWSNMSRLISKGLVIKSKRTEFGLTNDGILLATELLKEQERRPTNNEIINSKIDSMNEDLNNIDFVNNTINPENECSMNLVLKNDNDSAVCIELLASSFDVVLLIDKQETSGALKKNDPTVAQFQKYSDLKYEFRHLKVGDFTWIARHKTNPDIELVLPYIIERKRMDDLASSIKDGRFHEQKFRLKKCGIPNVIYLIENYGRNKHVGLPIQSLMQAISNTRVQDHFKVHITDSLTNSVRFLAIMTKRLTMEYKDYNLKGQNREPINDELMTFTYFNNTSSKNKSLSITETFIKLLLQLKGVSVEKALAITNVYNTPKSLIEAYKSCNQKEGQMLLANLKHSEISRSVGPSVSKAIYDLFSINNLQ